MFVPFGFRFQMRNHPHSYVKDQFTVQWKHRPVLKWFAASLEPVQYLGTSTGTSSLETYVSGHDELIRNYSLYSRPEMDLCHLQMHVDVTAGK